MNRSSHVSLVTSFQTLVSKSSKGIVASLALLPIVAACATPTTQTPEAVQPAPESPIATTPETTPAPTTGAAQTGDNIVEVAQANPSLSTFASVVGEADLGDTLDGDGPFTVFAPSNEAFNAVPAETRQRLLQPENRQVLRQVLTNHVVQGQRLTAAQIQPGSVQTVAGNSVDIQVPQANQVRVGEATVTQPDLVASNGVIHVIDQILLPPNFNL
ncbi:fasciclin domain-containing protein [Myxacorys almedinensis]|uniref:Fasciclin domain-containing protein n=1 Tax=Myxacorys almedinensis A TaxID=2690445 RepID=A0A8J7YWA0_9CYAN|nr:fasciclin domain-containing protein [Myxacorys almedinensis]NDJ15779.1 fasciclin domain-containing protein [Myxacorys almedinensis A]